MLRIKGGKVYDPANSINGVIQDISIDNGRIVAEVSGGRTLDATGMIVFPGVVPVSTPTTAFASVSAAEAAIDPSAAFSLSFIQDPDATLSAGGNTDEQCKARA